jgi:hypothetical protein
MNPLEYYRTQSRITEPGEYVGLFDDLPRDVSGLCQIVRGLIFPIDAEELYGYKIPKDRRREVDTRYVDKMLARIIELDDRALPEPRLSENRLVGCDRDRVVLLCAILRHQDVPARIRDGFAPYISGFDLEFIVRHIALEYWNADEQRWCLVDPGQDDLLVAQNNIQFDPMDIPRDQFAVAGKVWQMCRTGKAEPDTFGEFPDTFLKGWWFIRNTLVRDLAFLNKTELLLWDSWGDLMVPELELTEEQLALLDQVATLTQAGNETLEKMRTVYEGEPVLKVPSVIACFSPVTEPSDVVLAI